LAESVGGGSLLLGPAIETADGDAPVVVSDTNLLWIN